MKNKLLYLLLIECVFLIGSNAFAQNPIVRDQFTADPSARVFGDRVYVFPSHDIRCAEGQGRGPDWFCMADYHVFSSENLTEWTDHGMILSQDDVAWADHDAYSMWAPDCIERNGKYYFYFPTIVGDTARYWRGFGIGVAVADQPEGPYTAEAAPIDKIRGIDPGVLIDKDGQAYIYWSGGHIFGAKLKDNMLELASDPVILKDLPPINKGLKEGPWVFERNGIYYMTYPHVENKTERLEYAISDNPLGPFEIAGVIMDESPTGCWTNHHSMIEFKDQWYLFYHHNDYSPGFDKNRSIRLDSLSFNEDGTIQKVTPTLRGAGLTKASDKIQIDRYSKKSEEGTSIAFLDTLNTFAGWKTIFENENAWIQYNAVDFEGAQLTSVSIKAKADKPGTVQIKLKDGTVITEVEVPETESWELVKVPFASEVSGIQDLVLTGMKEGQVEIDWLSFE